MSPSPRLAKVIIIQNNQHLPHQSLLHRERPITPLCLCTPKGFQSTLPRWERLQHTTSCQVMVCFNPHSHVGSDLQYPLKVQIITVSIHAPTRGATHSAAGGTYISPVSIHAPTWGATQIVLIKNAIKERFQSTLPRGERLILLERWKENYIVSIHAPTQGATITVAQRL